jgi:hypothetical protein
LIPAHSLAPGFPFPIQRARPDRISAGVVSLAFGIFQNSFECFRQLLQIKWFAQESDLEAPIFRFCIQFNPTNLFDYETLAQFEFGS